MTTKQKTKREGKTKNKNKTEKCKERAPFHDATGYEARKKVK
jgi:hypothetical protein